MNSLVLLSAVFGCAAAQLGAFNLKPFGAWGSLPNWRGGNDWKDVSDLRGVDEMVSYQPFNISKHWKFDFEGKIEHGSAGPRVARRS